MYCAAASTSGWNSEVQPSRSCTTGLSCINNSPFLDSNFPCQKFRNPNWISGKCRAETRPQLRGSKPNITKLKFNRSKRQTKVCGKNATQVRQLCEDRQNCVRITAKEIIRSDGPAIDNVQHESRT